MNPDSVNSSPDAERNRGRTATSSGPGWAAAPRSTRPRGACRACCSSGSGSTASRLPRRTKTCTRCCGTRGARRTASARSGCSTSCTSARPVPARTAAARALLRSCCHARLRSSAGGAPLPAGADAVSGGSRGGCQGPHRQPCGARGLRGALRRRAGARHGGRGARALRGDRDGLCAAREQERRARWRAARRAAAAQGPSCAAPAEPRLSGVAVGGACACRSAGWGFSAGSSIGGVGTCCWEA